MRTLLIVLVILLAGCETMPECVDDCLLRSGCADVIQCKAHEAICREVCR